MTEFKKELKELLTKYNAEIFVAMDEDDSFLRLQLKTDDETETIDTGYMSLVISQNNL